MNFSQQPISTILKGPLLSTPQGIACILFSAVAIITGTLYLLLPASLSSHKFLGFGGAIFIWPVLLFVIFVKHSMNDFRPSWWATAMVSFYGLIPFAIPLWRTP
ncbi:hypothetical protein A9179_01600 [Pseudomonas alcaligenes]|uniref:Uncharacterized protein n=1 Tax=Aquipseudomonas alcaligenes TaxID=43263 RepID=A0ABR7RUU2_AQUAC|nr:hypothetical protein [Pseudomonas alcaligenes]MBC9248960.1 hypothetical protein [Pseudomonas alcaligenes]